MTLDKDIETFTTAILLALIAGIIVYFIKYKKMNLPPGPWSLPIIGNWSLLGMNDAEDIYLRFSKLEKIYGPIFSFKIGQQLCIVLSDPEAIKEALSKNELAGKTSNFNVLKDFSVYIQPDEMWSQHRRYLMQCMRELCIRRNDIQEYIIVHMKNLVSRLMNHSANPINIHEELFSFTYSVLSEIFFGQNLNSENETILRRKLEAMMDKFRRCEILTFHPRWYDISRTRRTHYEFHEACCNVTNTFSSIIRKQIYEQETSTNSSQNFHNILRMYLCEIAQNGKGSKYDFNEMSFIKFIIPTYVAGNTAADRLEGCFYLLAVRPDIQSKIQNEIDQVIGSKRIPAFSDKDNMPYAQSFLLELLRLTVGKGLFFQRRASEDTQIMSYDIPKNAIVISNIVAMNRNRNYWENPEDFQSERFLNPKNSNSVEKPSYFLPFSCGKRKCPGEILGQMELFLGLVCVLQKLDVQLVNEKSEALDESCRYLRSFKKPEMRFFPRKLMHSDT